MTSPADVLVRPAYRPYLARVAGVRRLSPAFLRVTFTSPDFAHVGTAGLDQRVKLVLPRPDGSLCDVGQTDPEIIAAGTWYQTWRDLPAHERGPFRTYTIGRTDPDAGEVDIDFVLHHDAGPAGSWAERAAVGDEIVLVGPDERSEQRRLGIDWHPGTARRLLLAGDETAVPAIGAIVGALGDDVDADVFVEVPTSADVLTWAVPARTRVRWIGRDGADHGAGLIDAVSRWCAGNPDCLERAAAPRPEVLADIDVDRDLLWDAPQDGDGEFYAWIAGEAATVKTLRRMLVSAHGVDRKRVAFMGYWRLGQAERQE
ncbi:siderophore-interacting protein [Microbacterium lushaniae]|nr:siderophore-interacting protein [Microbacterium lushaniae]KAA9151950.1 siderophore-interacting protein [Microbacterium lushaniae]